MAKENAIRLFQDKKVRTSWDETKERWYFSVTDVVAVLTDNDFQSARKYWNKLAQRLREEGNEMMTNCHQLRLEAEDDKLSYLIIPFLSLKKTNSFLVELLASNL